MPVHSLGSCTLTVSNAGPATARFVTAAIALPYHLAPIWGGRSGSWFGGAGLWFVGSLAPGASVSFSVGFVALGPTWGPVLGAAFSFNRDPNVANNIATADVTVTG